METDNEFVLWLVQKIEQKGWNNAEFCRRSGISQSMMSLVISGERQPGKDFCQGVSRAFDDVTVENCLRRIGWLPKLPAGGSDPTLQELLDLAKNLSFRERRELVEYAKWRYGQAQREDHQG